jgi:phosphoglycolate phosphatase-like HAD superfamily hydrolase
MPAPTIVFDLDGTLIDTAPDLIQRLTWFSHEKVWRRYISRLDAISSVVAQRR